MAATTVCVSRVSSMAVPLWEADPGSFQILTSALRSGACDIFCVPFKSLYFPQPSGSPTLVFKAKLFEALSSWCKTPSLGSPMWGSNPSFHG